MSKQQIKHASIQLRMCAQFIDILIICLFLFSFFYLIGLNPFVSEDSILSLGSARITERQLARNLFGRSLPIIWILYNILMEASSLQGTLGKRLVKIKVVNAYGSPISLFDSFHRNLAKILSSALFGLGFLWILFDKNKQAWHDIFAKTYVVKTEKND